MPTDYPPMNAPSDLPHHPAITTLRERTLKTIRQHSLLGTTPPQVVVGVSGGADSMALLHVLNSLRKTLNIVPIAATLDHGLRGDAGAADVQYVVEKATEWGIEVHAGKADVREIAAEQKLSIEAAARKARYEFLADCAQTVGTHRITVAHHADDQAETVLMRLLRGTGVGGLSGMLPITYTFVPKNPTLSLHRPFLFSTRAEIEAYCAAVGILPRQDETNNDTDFLRNRIRLEVIPYLQQINPQISRVLGRLGESAAQDEYLIQDGYVVDALEDNDQSFYEVQPDEVRYTSQKMFRDLFPGVQRRVITFMAAQISDSMDITYDNILAAVQVARDGEPGAIALLPHGLRLRVEKTSFVIERYHIAPNP